MSLTVTVMIPLIPRLNGDDYFLQSVQGGGGSGRRFQQSTLVMVLVVPGRNVDDLAAMDDIDNGENDEMLPLHEIVAWSSRFY